MFVEYVCPMLENEKRTSFTVERQVLTALMISEIVFGCDPVRADKDWERDELFDAGGGAPLFVLFLHKIVQNRIETDRIRRQNVPNRRKNVRKMKRYNGLKSKLRESPRAVNAPERDPLLVNERRPGSATSPSSRRWRSSILLTFSFLFRIK